MISVTKHIEFLLSKNECVIIPALGAFIRTQNLSIGECDGQIKRPQINIMFNPSLVHDDVMLAYSLMRVGLSKQNAYDEINRFVNSVNSQIISEGVAPIGRIGYFTKLNDSLLFTPFPKYVLSYNYFGLTDVNVPLLKKVPTKEKKENLIDNVAWGKYKKNLFRVASMIVMVLLSVILTTPKISDNKITFANTQIIEIKSHLNAQENSSSIMNDNSGARTFYVRLPNDELKTQDENVKYLVISVLSTKNQVDMLCKEKGLKNINVKEHNGRYCVYIAKGDFESLREIQKAYQDEYPSAWIL